MALVLTLSQEKDPYLTITHEGEICYVYLQEVRRDGRVVLRIDGPRSFAILRAGAKVKEPKSE